MSKAQVILDIPYDQPLQDFLLRLHRHKAEIAGWQAQGPGGGNPEVCLHFPDALTALVYLEEVYPDDDPNFRRDRVTAVEGFTLAKLLVRARAALIESASRSVQTHEGAENSHAIANEITKEFARRGINP